MKIKLICQECKKPFYRIPSRSWGSKPGMYGRVPKKFCSSKCANITLRKFWNSLKEKKRRSKRQIGDRNSNYGNGLQKVMGYIWVNHPAYHLHKIQNRIPRSILVMEKHLGRRLKKAEVVHHIDGDRTNDNINNLKLFENVSKHMYHHGKQRSRKLLKRMWDARRRK